MSNIYQHFRDSEKEFIDGAIDWLRRVNDYYTPYLTSFLDPREQYILQTISGQYDGIDIEFHGGHENAERKRALIFPDYYEVREDDFKIEVIELKYLVKFSTLSHGSIMGSILGSGITREKLGDIINQSDRWQFFMDATIKDFVMLQVDKIGRTSVTLMDVSKNDILEAKEDWIEDTEIISSLRIDVFIASCLNLGRDKSKTLIESNRVKLNWTEIDKINMMIEPSDIISIRGFGRIKFIDIISRTKKDKYLVQVLKMLH